MNLSNIRTDRLAVRFYRPLHPGRGRARPRQQRLDKTARVFRAEVDDLAPGNGLLGGLTCVGNDKRRHGPPFERGGLRKKTFVRARDPRHESLSLLLQSLHWHNRNVRLIGIQIKN